MRTVPVRAAIRRPARGRPVPGVWNMVASPVLVVGEGVVVWRRSRGAGREGGRCRLGDPYRRSGARR
jgi:hypothetical protein